MTTPASAAPAEGAAIRARAARPPESRRPRNRGVRRGQGAAGWLFVSPALAILIVFMLLPILFALYVSFTSWDGFTDPLRQGLQWVGLSNYRKLVAEPGLYRLNFMTAVRNNFYFVLIVVPAQTLLALVLAVLVNNRFLKGKGGFRTAFYFPSVTSSIAITLVFIFLFQGGGAVNAALKLVGINGPNWLIDTNGILNTVYGWFGSSSGPSWGQHQFLSLTIWQWLSGPSVGMCVLVLLCVWTTSGTFMLMFIAGLQNISEEVEEASMLDGASAWQRFWKITVPMLRPTLALVITLGLIGTWQLFDQVYLVGKNNPTTITPAYYSYSVSFANQAFGIGAAVAFLLFLLIVGLSALQRRLIREDVD